MEAWRPLLFADEQQENKKTRDPVSPAKRSDKALQKVATRQLDDGTAARSFQNLLDHMGAIVRATCRCLQQSEQEATFTMITRYNHTQQKAMDLLEQITL